VRPPVLARKRRGARTKAPRAKSPSTILDAWVLDPDVEEIVEESQRLVEGTWSNQPPAEEAVAFVELLRNEAHKVLRAHTPAHGQEYTDSDAWRWFNDPDGAMFRPQNPEVLAAAGMRLRCISLESAIFDGNLRAVIIYSFILGVLAVRAGIGELVPLLEHATRGRKVLAGSQNSGASRAEQVRAEIAKEIRRETRSAESDETIRKVIENLNPQARKKTG
jgi:hypothetical protein